MNEFKKIMLAIGNAFLAAAKSVSVDAEPETETPPAAEPEGAEGTEQATVTLASLGVKATKKLEGVFAAFSEDPAGQGRADLWALMDALKIPHKKSVEDCVKVLKAAIKKMVAEKAAPSTSGDEDEKGEESEKGDEFDGMDRAELKAHIAENELDVAVTKAMSDDDIREAIRAASGEEDEKEKEEEADQFAEMDRSELKAYIADKELDIAVTKAMDDDEIRAAIREQAGDESGDAGGDAKEEEGKSGNGAATEKKFLAAAKEFAGDEDGFDVKEAKSAIEKFVKLGTPPDAESAARMGKIKSLLKAGKMYPAYVEMCSAFMGQSEDGLTCMEINDPPYVRGEEVWSNGAPLVPTKQEGIGKDWATGKLYKVATDGSTTPVKK